MRTGFLFRLLLVGIVSFAGLLPRGLAAERRPSKQVPSEVEALVLQLKSSGFAQRVAAVLRLEALGSRAEPAIPALIDALGDPGPFLCGNATEWVNTAAARTLRRLGQPAARALRVAALGHRNGRVRDAALELLVASDPEAAVPTLLSALRIAKVRTSAALALCEADPTESLVPVVLLPGARPLSAVALHALRHGDTREWAAGLGVLQKRGCGREAIPLLLALLKDEASDREKIISTLGRIGAGDRRVVQALAEMAVNPVYGYRAAAVDALGEIGAAAEPAVPALVKLLRDEMHSEQATLALIRIGPRARAAVPTLIATLEGSVGRVGSPVTAAAALGKFATETRTVVPALEKALGDRNTEVAEAAAASLGRLGPVAVPALVRTLEGNASGAAFLAVRTLERMGPTAVAARPALRAYLKEGPRAQRVAVARALFAVDPRSAKVVLPVLVEAVRDGDWETGCAAAGALHRMGPAAAAVVPDLRPLLGRAALGTEVAHALRGIGPAARAAVPELTAALRSRDESLRAEAAAALGAIGKDAAAAVATLGAALRDPKPVVRWSAAGALGRIGPAAAKAVPQLIGPAAAKAVPQLIRALDDPHLGVRVSAAYALGHLGPAAAPAVPALVKGVTADHPLQRWASFTALRLLGPTARKAVPALAALAVDPAGVVPMSDTPASADGTEANPLDDPGGDVPTRPAPRERFDPWRLVDADAPDDPEWEDVPARTAFRKYLPATVASLAIRALAAVGADARAAVPALLRASRDDRVSVRLAAVAALRRIDPDALATIAPTPRDLKRLWSDLGGPDGAKSYRAFWSLVLAPEQTVPWLRERLKPAAPIDAARLTRLVSELDDEQFTVREKAAETLLALGDSATPALTKALASRPSLELRRRAEDLLRRLEDQGPPPEQLLALRGVAILERIGTPEARQVLAALAKGATQARLTREARAALRRLPGTVSLP